MKYCILIIFLIIVSCGYSDIDSVPDFKYLKITEEESIELCKLKSKNKDPIYIKCLSEYYSKNFEPNFKLLNLLENDSIKLCNLIYSDKIKEVKCLHQYYLSEEKK